MPQLHDETFSQALRRAAGYGETGVTLEDLLARIPPIDSLADLPEGTPVWIRADLDVADRDGVIGEDPRLAGLHETLEFGRTHGWRMLLIGHLRRASCMIRPTMTGPTRLIPMLQQFRLTTALWGSWTTCCTRSWMAS